VIWQGKGEIEAVAVDEHNLALAVMYYEGSVEGKEGGTGRATPQREQIRFKVGPDSEQRIVVGFFIGTLCRVKEIHSRARSSCPTTT